MQSRHDFETEVALLDNVQTQMPNLLAKLIQSNCLEDSKTVRSSGVYVYRIPKQTKALRRVVRIPIAIFRARGNTFSRPKNYTERRASDQKTDAGYLSSHRRKQVKVIAQ